MKKLIVLMLLITGCAAEKATSQERKCVETEEAAATCTECLNWFYRNGFCTLSRTYACTKPICVRFQ